MPDPAADSFVAETVQHLAELRRAARRLAPAGAPVGADDLVQETFLRAFAARARYRRGSNARAWLYKILHHTASNARRREGRDARLRERLTVEPRAEAVPGPIPLSRLSDAVDALPDLHRRVVLLADVEGASYREIAIRLALPIGTVMSRLHRARRRLRCAAAG